MFEELVELYSVQGQVVESDLIYVMLCSPEAHFLTV
jgi:hypothetical protein